MSNNKTTKETLYQVDNKPTLHYWVDFGIATVITAWTFIRPWSNWGGAWKVYLVNMGNTIFPMSATDTDYLWRKIKDHSYFKTLLPTNSSIEVTAEAWSIDGVRLQKEDVLIKGTKVTFEKQDAPKTLGELLRENLAPKKEDSPAEEFDVAYDQHQKAHSEFDEQDEFDAAYGRHQKARW